MRIVLFIVDVLIIFVVAGGLYLAYEEGKDRAKKEGDKK